MNAIWGAARGEPANKFAPKGLTATKYAYADSGAATFLAGGAHDRLGGVSRPRRRPSWPEALRRGFNRWPMPATKPILPLAQSLAARSSPRGGGQGGGVSGATHSPSVRQGDRRRGAATAEDGGATFLPLSSWEREPGGAVVVTHLTKTFEVRPILRRVSFALAAGRRMALLGPNGAGKTTLLRILATLAKPSGGRVVVAGCDLEDAASEARWCVGYVGHQTGLYDELTARENLLFFARMFGLRDGPNRADALLARVGLRARANDRVAAFSRGQAQRLALARGVMHEPEVLLLDEPDTGLDEDALTLLTELLVERAEAAQTTIFTTHQLARGLAQSDRALILVGGRVAYDGPSAALDVAAVRAYYAGKAADEDTDDTSVVCADYDGRDGAGGER